MKNRRYPAVFHREEDGRYFVEFPDIEGCFTEGRTLEEARNMAADALYVCLKIQAKYPIASSIEVIKADNNAIIELIKPQPYETQESKDFLKTLDE